MNCTVHRSIEGIAICSRCSRSMCFHCHQANSFGYAVCEDCEAVFEKSNITTCPWEEASLFEMPLAFLSTSKNVLFRPIAFFSEFAFFSQNAKTGLGRAISFGLLCHVIGAFASGLYQYFFSRELFEKAFTEMNANFQLAEEIQLTSEEILPYLILILPIVGAIAFLMHWILMHLALKIAGAKSSWALSAKLIGYTSAAYLAQLIPPIADFPIGHFIAIGFLIQLQTTAIRFIFKLSMGRTFLVVALPFLASMLFMI